jgi:dihydrofolate reductase
MGALIYSAITSLDGFVADEAGRFDWAVPDEEVHAFINDRQRPVGTYLFGRRMYETMVAWEAIDTGDDQPRVMREFAKIWRGTDKIVYSRTMDTVSSARTRIERDFDAHGILRVKSQADRDLMVAGPELAGQAFRAGVVDELQLYVAPILVGGGTPCHPPDLRLKLELLEERRFGNGMVFLRYSVDAGAPPTS